MTEGAGAPVVGSYSSRALTDTTCVLLWAERERLVAHLRPIGLELQPVRDVSRALHPIWLDLGQIKLGAGEALDLDQHAWWRRTGDLAGSALGLFAGGMRGAERGRAVASDLAERFSRSLSRSLGTYREIIVAVPNVTTRRGSATYAFVLNMLTDSPIALWGDRALGYGYGKRLCELTTARFTRYSGRFPLGEHLFDASVSRDAASEWAPIDELSDARPLLELLSQPLLGTIGADRFAVSRLDRDYAVQALAAPHAVDIRVAPELTRGLVAGRFHVSAVSSRTPWGALCVADLPTRVSYPEQRRGAQL